MKDRPAHSDSDSDDENHDDHKSKHDKSHAHDEHSEHHHHHRTYDLLDGQQLKVNEFHHDPNHENGETHYHDVEIVLKDGSRKPMRFFHEGRVHQDVPSWHHMAKYWNTKPGYYKQTQAVELSKSNCAPTEDKHAHTGPAPSAPDLPPAYDEHHEKEAPKYNPTLTGQMQQQHTEIRQNLLENGSKKEDDCCGCRIS